MIFLKSGRRYHPDFSDYSDFSDFVITGVISVITVIMKIIVIIVIMKIASRSARENVELHISGFFTNFACYENTLSQSFPINHISSRRCGADVGSAGMQIFGR